MNPGIPSAVKDNQMQTLFWGLCGLREKEPLKMGQPLARCSDITGLLMHSRCAFVGHESVVHLFLVPLPSSYHLCFSMVSSLLLPSLTLNSHFALKLNYTKYVLTLCNSFIALLSNSMLQ